MNKCTCAQTHRHDNDNTYVPCQLNRLRRSNLSFSNLHACAATEETLMFSLPIFICAAQSPTLSSYFDLYPNTTYLQYLLFYLHVTHYGFTTIFFGPAAFNNGSECYVSVIVFTPTLSVWYVGRNRYDMYMLVGNRYDNWLLTLSWPMDILILVLLNNKLFHYFHLPILYFFCLSLFITFPGLLSSIHKYLL